MISHKLPESLPLLDKYKVAVSRVEPVCSIGYVSSIRGHLLKASTLDTRLGDVCHVMLSEDEYIITEAVGFDGELVILAPLKEPLGVRPGCRVVALGHPLSININDRLIGKVVDALGYPMEEGEKIISEDTYPLNKLAASPLERLLIDTPMYTGVRSIDTFLTLGRGQRVGIFSGSGVGKSTLLGMIARYSEADVNVIALIGERGREINEFIHKELGEHGIKKSILVVASADESPMYKIKASFTALTIAEYFREQGKDVLLLLDSLTRFAMAQREVGLAAGEPATTKGYPPSVYSLLPKLVERAGVSPKGSITGIYTVLVEADDMNEPVSDAVRGILDGHIILERKLANKGHFPAIDIPASVSRLAKQVLPASEYNISSSLRELLSVYQENEEIVQLGAYASGSNLVLDKAIQAKPALDQFLRQEIEFYSAPDKTWSEIKSIHSSLLSDEPSAPVYRPFRMAG